MTPAWPCVDNPGGITLVGAQGCDACIGRSMNADPHTCSLYTGTINTNKHFQKYTL